MSGVATRIPVALTAAASPKAPGRTLSVRLGIHPHKEIPTQMARKPTTPAKPARVHATAESMATKQKEIAVSEFFAKNRHLLGFDNPRKALLTTVKEAVDNSLDACEEAGILPTLHVTIEALNGGA